MYAHKGDRKKGHNIISETFPTTIAATTAAPTITI